VKDGYLHVEGENSVTLLVAAATSYDGADPTTDCVNVLNEASEYSYAELHSRHIDEYGELFGRVSVDLGEPDSRPTDERLAAVQDEEHDPDLAALYFQFSRYLLLTSSYDCQLPANLQGIWNGEMYPEWESDFHLNINLQMNYWPAQVCNLPECVEPLVSFVDDLRASGRRTAREHYGCDGFVAHHATDAWSTTTPVWSGGVWPMGVTWLCRLLWDHYAFSEDEQFLREYGYPILKEHAEFFLDFLVEDDDGRLVTAPSNSPENRFVTSSGYEALYCTGPTLDIQLLRDLFNNLIEASAVIERDDPIVDDVSDAVEDLPSHRIGDRGQLQEWLEDHDEADPGHRHISHLYGAYPSDQITLRETPDLARATRTTLERRLEHGSGNTGWSRAWFISQYARLEEGDIAHKHLYESLNTYTAANLFGIHPDFETGEPIFQIDGNFGGGAGIAEMLLQSHQRELKILPALPTEWSDGRVEGLRARGDFEVEIAWTDGSLHDLVVHSDGGNRCRVRTYNGIEVDSVKTDSGIAIEYDHLDENIVAFDTEPGTTYRLKYS
jgi:alpha-L-fucosidase 2